MAHKRESLLRASRHSAHTCFARPRWHRGILNLKRCIAHSNQDSTEVHIISSDASRTASEMAQKYTESQAMQRAQQLPPEPVLPCKMTMTIMRIRKILMTMFPWPQGNPALTLLAALALLISDIRDAKRRDPPPFFDRLI